MAQEEDLMKVAAAEVERSLSDSIERLPGLVDTLCQSLRMVDGGVPAAARNALMSMEIVVGESMAANVWLLHQRGEHGRAAELRHLATQVQRAVSAALEAARH